MGWIRKKCGLRLFKQIFGIYAISQIMAKLNNGESVSQRIRINSHDLLRFTNRGTSGRDYMSLQDSLEY